MPLVDLASHNTVSARATEETQQNTGSAHVTGKLDHHFAKYDSVQEL